MPSGAKFVDAQPSIHLEPHFAVVRNFDELKDILERVADAESPLPNMINIPIVGRSPDSPINRVTSEFIVTSPEASSPIGALNAPFPTETNPPKPTGSSPAGPDGVKGGDTSSGESSLLFDLGPSPTQAKPRRNRILCVWDVDDTLVASGTSGVRQHPIFRESQLRPLFRHLEKAGTTRHLLLSQGSIDDVFAKDGSGRLRYLQKYFFSEADAEDDADEVGYGKSGLFVCGRSSKPRKKPNGLSAPAIIGRNTQVVRLSRIHSEPVKESDVAWLSGDGSDAPVVENGSLATRWLFVRPSLAGISLCSLNTPVQPSPYTAFVDGKALRKLDVVWSLAASGHWDNVFFIDNNLSEVGVVTSNMQMSNLFDLQSEHREARFFHNELTMVAVANFIRNLCYLHGRDVTVPPSKSKPISETFGPARAATQGGRGGGAGQHGAPLCTACTEDTTNTTTGSASKDIGPDHSLPLTPSGCSANSSSDNVETGSLKRPPSRSHASELRPTDGSTIDGAVFAQPKPDAAAALCPTQPPKSTDAAPPQRVVRLVIANLHIPYDVYRRLLTSRTSAANDGTGGAAVVISQKNMTRRPNNMAHAHYRGHPLFNKDTSCTDDQYDSIIRMFRQHLSYVLDLMAEDLRQQGYLWVNPNSKFPASIEQVMLRAYRVPSRIPCIRAPYQSVCLGIERAVLTPLRKGGGTKEGVSIIKSAANRFFQQLVQTSPLVDPLVIGGLCSILVEIYQEDGSVVKAQTKRLEAQLHRVLTNRPS